MENTETSHNPTASRPHTHRAFYDNIYKRPQNEQSLAKDLGCSVCHQPWGAAKRATVAANSSDEYKAYSRIIETRLCGHYFHRACLHSSVEKDPKCPLCRTRFFGISEYGRSFLHADARFPVPFKFSLWQFLPYNTLREVCERIVHEKTKQSAQSSSANKDTEIPKGPRTTFNLDACYSDATRSKILKIVVNMYRVHIRTTTLWNELVELYEAMAQSESRMAESSKEAATILKSLSPIRAVESILRRPAEKYALRESMKDAMHSGCVDRLPANIQEQHIQQMGDVFKTIEASFRNVGICVTPGPIVGPSTVDEKRCEIWHKIGSRVNECFALSVELKWLD